MDFPQFQASMEAASPHKNLFPAYCSVRIFSMHPYLPLIAKGSYLLEKMGVINFRRKILKRIKQPP
ncbi:hypothetical protein H5410_037064 [Solanum commersonii]|uniref:Uncharacterized protein n=1 Tax=Solanum commersonii TaxID=4109 RepID=A0A9J5Y8F5_SOLCO|nr:hypothetical protein H5410_037064 [Solanum commersonii]